MKSFLCIDFSLYRTGGREGETIVAFPVAALQANKQASMHRTFS